MYMYAHAYTHKHIYSDIHKCRHLYAYTHINACTYVYRKDTDIHTVQCSIMHIYETYKYFKCIYMYISYKHAYINTFIYIEIYIYIHIHTLICKHIAKKMRTSMQTKVGGGGRLLPNEGPRPLHEHTIDRISYISLWHAFPFPLRAIFLTCFFDEKSC